MMEAMELCQQGMQSNGPDNDLRLLPSTVSGAEFFTAALNSFYSNNISTTTSSSPNTSMKTTTTSTRSVVESSGKKQEIHTERIRLLYAVYSFLRIWDKSILEKLPGSHNSRLAEIIKVFPDNILDETSTIQFKQLFGYM